MYIHIRVYMRRLNLFYMRNLKTSCVLTILHIKKCGKYNGGKQNSWTNTYDISEKLFKNIYSFICLHSWQNDKNFINSVEKLFYYLITLCERVTVFLYLHIVKKDCVINHGISTVDSVKCLFLLVIF